MATFKEYNNLGEELEKLLILRTSPLAIKMLETEADIPEGAIRPKRAAITTLLSARPLPCRAAKESASPC